mmetsp:Transcript_5393/g.11937  ORF Transcript_5393/g.11937 Transcript_5393/m.11937 type:complete len:101 (-) Transcript_5393:246-548(-)
MRNSAVTLKEASVGLQRKFLQLMATGGARTQQVQGKQPLDLLGTEAQTSFLLLGTCQQGLRVGGPTLIMAVTHVLLHSGRRSLIRAAAAACHTEGLEAMV